MKKLFLLLALLGFVFTACEKSNGLDDENGANETASKIKLEKQTVEVDYKSADHQVNVTSPCSWKATTENDWIIVNSETGDKGDAILKFSVDRNNELKDRKGTITLQNSDYNLKTELCVIQKVQIGAIVTQNGATGVLFYADDTITKIMSVEETRLAWCTEYEATGAEDLYDGVNNMATVKNISGWEDKYPAFKWCADYGENWYLPAYYELREIDNQRKALNDSLEKEGYATLDLSNYPYYWSSTEFLDYGAFYLSFESGFFYSEANSVNRVRAILVF